jgi:uncharacterized membrane protein (DUF373 family)
MSGLETPVMHRATKFLEWAVDWIEVVVAAILALLIAVSVAAMVVVFVRALGAFPANTETMRTLLTAIIDVFIVIELFKITIAYARHHDVIPTVLETGLVVAAREIIVVQAGKENPVAAFGLAAILVAIGLTWFLLRRARALETHPHEDGSLPDRTFTGPASNEETT